MKKLIFFWIALFLVSFGVSYKVAEAKTRKIWICHKPGVNQQSLYIPVPAWPGHKEHGDYKGKCRPFKPVCKWSEWSECRLPEGKECGKGRQVRYLRGDGCSNEAEWRCCRVKCEPTPTPSPEPTPTEKPTPTPTEKPKPPENPITEAGANICTDDAPANLPANPLVWRKGGTAIVQWQPTGGDNANIYYFENQNPDNAHAVRDIPNNGYVVIEELGSKDWTFGIQQSGGCAGGSTVWVEDGGTNGWVLFTP